MDLIELIKELNKLFNTYDFHVYAVGGTVRDYLLKRELKDFDFATDAKPEDMKYILENYNDIFLKLNGNKNGVNDYNDNTTSEDSGKVDENNNPIYVIKEYSPYAKLFFYLYQEANYDTTTF